MSVGKGLFETDIFSSSNIQWNSLSQTNRFSSICSELLSTSYSFTVGADFKLFSFEGVEINSKNTLVETPAGTFLLKFLGARNTREAPILEAADKNFSERLSFLPSIVLNDEGQRITESGDQRYLLYTRVGNRHFSGRPSELAQFAENFCKFYHATSQDMGGFLTHPLLHEGATDQLTDFFNRRRKGARSKYVQMLIESRDFVERETSECLSKLSDAHFENTMPLHIDLHPHNVTVGDDELFFVDLASIQCTSVSRSLGFALFKLIRQSVVGGLALDECHNVVSNTSLRELLDRVDLTNCMLKDAAKQEVLRRLFIIVNDLIMNGSSQWERVIPMHLIGLKEIDLIYE